MPDLVLGIDTSVNVSVGLARDGYALNSRVETDRMAHVEQLVPLLHDCLVPLGATLSDVAQIVVGVGPGPFTGLRVGVVTAQILGRVLSVPVHGVCSLDVIAQVCARYALRTGGLDEFVIASDARRREVYWARYASDGQRLEGPAVGSPDAVPRVPTFGPAIQLYPDRLTRHSDSVNFGLSGTGLAMYGLELPSAGTEPLYLRRPDATEPTRRKSVLRLPPNAGARP